MFVTRIQPRVSETDGVGHINNTTVPAWLEAGREEIFRMFMPELDFSNWRLIIVNVNVDYVSQIFYGKEAEVHTWIKSIGNSSFVLYEEIHQNNKVCVKGTATYVNFNHETQKTEAIPQVIREQWQDHIYER